MVELLVFDLQLQVLFPELGLDLAFRTRNNRHHGLLLSIDFLFSF